MKILFLTIASMNSVEDYGVYTDMLRCFREMGHQIFTVSPFEKRTELKTKLDDENGVKMLHVSIGNITKCGIIEKGISTLQIETKFLSAIKKYYKNEKFDLILYSTPPITFAKVIRYIKRHDNARTYLMLKDIFPQNAVDIGMLSKTGIKGLIYKYFRRKEKKLYELSDRIGCMSQANVDYVLNHNPEIPAGNVEICPNCIEPVDMRLTEQERLGIREKYDIPQDKTVFVYGGNLGKPQGIPFIIDCLKTQLKNEKVYFLIVGDGTEFSKLQEFFDDAKPENMKLLKRLPKEDYDRMVAACDVGLIFLDHRFTIPNFPSRLLSYMQAGLPVLACTDSSTDVGKVIVDGGFGWWCESNDVVLFFDTVKDIVNFDLNILKKNEHKYLLDNYDVSKSCTKIIECFVQKNT